MTLALLLLTVLAPESLMASHGHDFSRPDLLIVGSPHLANNNRDVVQTQLEDVRTPKRQREIKALVDGLARYRPTRIAVERPVEGQAELDARYADWRAGKAELAPNEIEQIGFRLAAKLGLSHLDAVDWNGTAPMAEVDWDYAAWAQAHGQGAQVQARRARLQQDYDAVELRMRCTNIAEWYRFRNTPKFRDDDNARYFDIATLGAPGANWLGGYWYMRNLRIVTQIRKISGPQDRVLVLYGAGHGYLLDRYARESRAFTVSNTLRYLPRARSEPGC
jgi:glutaredoxin-related protein